MSAQGGRVFTAAGISVNSGASYCLIAWIRGTSDAIPFLGIQVSDPAGDLTGTEHWLMGLPGYTTGYPHNDVVATVTSDGNWSWYAKPFTLETGAGDIILKDENFGSGSADFDLIQLYAGVCPAAPATVCAAPVPSCQAAVCTDGLCASPKLMHQTRPPARARVARSSLVTVAFFAARAPPPATGGSSGPCDR